MPGVVVLIFTGFVPVVALMSADAVRLEDGRQRDDDAAVTGDDFFDFGVHGRCCWDADGEHGLWSEGEKLNSLQLS